MLFKLIVVAAMGPLLASATSSYPGGNLLANVVPELSAPVANEPAAVAQEMDTKSEGSEPDTQNAVLRRLSEETAKAKATSPELGAKAIAETAADKPVGPNMMGDAEPENDIVTTEQAQVGEKPLKGAPAPLSPTDAEAEYDAELSDSESYQAPVRNCGPMSWLLGCCLSPDGVSDEVRQQRANARPWRSDDCGDVWEDCAPGKTCVCCARPGKDDACRGCCYYNADEKIWGCCMTFQGECICAACCCAGTDRVNRPGRYPPTTIYRSHGPKAQYRDEESDRR